MLDVSEYIKLILKKKGWTNVRLCQELNKLESQLGDSRTSPQNISNYLNKQYDFKPKMLVKYEKVLGLQPNILVNMVQQPVSKESKKELREFIKKVGEIR